MTDYQKAWLKIDEAFMADVWAALNAPVNDLRKQQRILAAFRKANGRDE